MRKSLALVFLVYLFSFSIGHSIEGENQNLGFYLHVEHMEDSTFCSFYEGDIQIESFLVEEGSIYQNHFSNSIKIVCDDRIDYVELIVYSHGSSKNLYEEFFLDEKVIEYEIQEINNIAMFYSFPLFVVLFSLVLYIRNYSTRVNDEDPYL